MDQCIGQVGKIIEVCKYSVTVEFEKPYTDSWVYPVNEIITL